ncbi:MAG: Asp-tRNA(Asn)/Glu-tRNA(Gln) amidotransferase subunit GatB [Vulcanimicrobiota bacterium]
MISTSKECIEVNYETVIGLEVHVELLTESKLFCRCGTRFGSPPNSQICPVCLGLPGVLPAVNRKAVEYLMKTGLALNCRIASFSKFDRKNYFYPDMPKNYQISQYDLPLALEGKLEITVNDGGKRVGIKRIHLEEDTGKSIHKGTIDASLYTLEDYNRAGVPLMEIVTEPDIRTPDEASLFLQSLRTILQWIEVSDCRMEEGSLRCDANISIRLPGAELGTKVEVKNMNSFKSVRDALEYEEKRQRDMRDKGEPIIQETRGWDEEKCITISMRSKETENDYRYFPEPDLLPLQIDDAWREKVKSGLPELPGARKKRFIEEYGLSSYDADCLTAQRYLSDFFEKSCALHSSPKVICNWLMGDVARYLKDSYGSLEDSRLTPEGLAELCRLIDKGIISGKIGKTILEEMAVTGKSPETLVKEHGLFQISDEQELIAVIDEVIGEQPKAGEDFRKGNEKTLSFLVGQVMKKTKGKANPEAVNRLLRERLTGG